MEDIAPKLLEQIKKLYSQGKLDNEKLNRILAKGKFDYIDASEYADELGNLLSNAFGGVFTVDTLPDGRLYFNIAKRTVEPTMKELQSDIADFTEEVQKQLNDAAKIGIKPIKPTLNQDKIDGIIDRLADAESIDDIKWILDEPIKTFARSVVDDAIKENAEFHGKSGMAAKIVRKSTGKCCEWCNAVAGTYVYPNVPKDVYRRHGRCRCTVDYVAGKRKQNVWTKAWAEEVEPEKISERKSVQYGENAKQNEIATDAIRKNYEYRRLEKGLNRVPYSELDDGYNSANFKGMSNKFADKTAKQFNKLSNEYENTCERIVVGKLDIGSAPAETMYAYNISTSTITLNKSIVNDYDKFTERMKKAVEKGQFPKMNAAQYDDYVITHEFAHTLMDFGSPLKNVVNAPTSHIKKARKEIKAIHETYQKDIRELTVAQKQAELDAITSFDESAWAKAQELTDKLRAAKISDYAYMSIDEFFAEAFADAKLGSEPSKYSKEVLEVIDKYFKKKG